VFSCPQSVLHPIPQPEFFFSASGQLHIAPLFGREIPSLLSTSIWVAGDKMDEAIIQHLKRKDNLLIAERATCDRGRRSSFVCGIFECRNRFQRREGPWRSQGGGKKSGPLERFSREDLIEIARHQSKDKKMKSLVQGIHKEPEAVFRLRPGLT